MPDISYSFCEVYSALYQIPVETIALTDGLWLSVRDYERSAGQAVAGVVIANPNAPTGICVAGLQPGTGPSGRRAIKISASITPNLLQLSVQVTVYFIAIHAYTVWAGT